MRITALLCTVLFFAATLKSQSPAELPLDSLITWVAQAAGKIYVNDNASEVHRYGLLCLARAEETGTIPQIVESAQNLALLHHVIEDINVPDSTLYYDQLALQYLLKTDDQAAIAKAYSYIGGDFDGINKLDSAQVYLLKSVAIFEKIGDQEGLAKTYRNLSALFRGFNYEDGIKYGLKGIEIQEEMGVPDSVVMALSWSYLVPSYISLEQLDKALAAAEKAVFFVKNHEKEDIGVTLRAYSWRAEAYQERKEYDKALVDHFYAWEFGKANVAHESTVGGFQEGIASALYDQGKYAEAIPYYEGFFSTMVDRDAALHNYLHQRYTELAECYEKVGRYQESNDQYRLASDLKDTLYHEQYESLKTELVQKYESDKKDETIAAQTALISQQRQIQWLYIGLAALLGLILLGLYLVYRRNRKTNALLQSLNKDLGLKNQQNELLLKEIHHRVKNNLQTISSLLSLQSAHIENPEVQGAVEQSQNRVFSMALIHQKLYQGENLAAIEMRDYLQVLGETIVDAFGISTEQIQIEYPMEEVELDVDTAIPLGLIANELLTNALKYAFPDDRKGSIQVSLQKIGDTFRFRVSDNGVGWQETDASGRKGFGSRLVQLLVQQLKGAIHRDGQHGVATEVEFAAG